MLIRIVILFLIFMLVMAMVQRALSGRGARKPTIDRLRCPTCKRVNLSNTPAPCARQDCGYR